MTQSCYADQNPIYKPAMRIIAAMTNSFPVEITTTFPHNYISGIIVRLVIMPGVGMEQANGLFASITVTGDTTFTMPIDTTYFDPFVIPDPPPSAYTCSQVVPIAEDTGMLSAAVTNVLPYRI